MTTHAVASLAALALFALLGGCGADDAVNGGEQAARESRAPATAATPNPHGGAALPSGPPWPSYEVEDYTFTLRVLCFCPDAGVPVTVTVAHGKVVDAVFARKGPNRTVGAAAPRWHRVTINDVIDAANDPDAARIRVRWPAGQDYPASVRVDRDLDTIDEEIGYLIRDVDPA